MIQHLSRIISQTAALGLVFLAISPVQAALVYEVAFDQLQYEIGQGESAEAKILFREIHERGSADIPKLDFSGGRNGDGIFSPGFVLDFAGIASDSGLGVEFDDSDFVLNTSLLSAAFSTVEFDAGLSRLTVIGQAISFEGIELAPRADGINDIYEFEIGRLRLTNLGGIGDQRTLLLSQPTVPFTNDFVDFSGTPPIRFGAASVSASAAVPEPSSVAVLAMGVSVVTLRRKRRTKKQLQR